MLRLRLAAAGMLTLGLLALAVPAASLAGGSAGDQQYTDPFGGGSHTASATSTTPASTTSSPAPSTTSSPAPSTTAAPAASSTAPDPTTVAATTTAGEPTATIATSSPMLPHTGYDAWRAVGFGVALLGGGILLRRRLRHN